MAEWSQLPGELLHLISTFLPAEIDVVRFRSVCSTFRAVVPPHPSRFPIIPNEGMSALSWGFVLSKRPIYYITAGDNSGWIIKLERENPDRMHLFHPLIRSDQSLPENFPRHFDFSNLRVLELGLEYTLQYINYRPLASSISEAGNLYMEKVAFCYDGGDKFTLLTIHVSGKLAVYKSGGDKWTVINDDDFYTYDDVIFHDGDFYAADSSGKTVLVDRNGAALSVSAVAGNVPGGGDKKHLVECDGGLLLVDLYLTIGEFEDLLPVEDVVITERAEKFKVYRLERNAGRWEEVSSLEDRIVFLGDNVCFTANVSDYNLGECRGNCIVFNDFLFDREEESEIVRGREILVFDMDSGSIGPATTYHGYPELFWPPPSWVYPAAPSVQGQLLLQDQLEQLDI